MRRLLTGMWTRQSCSGGWTRAKRKRQSRKLSTESCSRKSNDVDLCFTAVKY